MESSLSDQPTRDASLGKPPSLTIRAKIRFIWAHGGPTEPGRADELRSWLEAYFPGEYKTESVNRIAQMIRESQKVNIF